MKLEHCDIKIVCQLFVAIYIPHEECMKNLSRSLWSEAISSRWSVWSVSCQAM